MRNTSYDTNQRFIERFDLDLVTLKANLPAWYREHLNMLVRLACLSIQTPTLYPVRVIICSRHPKT